MSKLSNFNDAALSNKEQNNTQGAWGHPATSSNSYSFSNSYSYSNNNSHEPAAPVYQAPATPVHPVYQAPAQPVHPVYQAPAHPVYQAPTYNSSAWSSWH